MNEKMKVCKALASGESERVMTPYDYTIEELMEMDRCRAEGKISPLENKCPSLTDLQEQAGRYGKMAEQYLMENNFPKYMKMRSHKTLWLELVALSERIDKFQDEQLEAYEAPKGEDYLEKVRAHRAYRQMIEERIFEEFIKPFAED